MARATSKRAAAAAAAAALAVAAPLGIAHAARTLKTNPPLITDASTFSSQLVTLHNQLRAYHYNGADQTTPVTWDASLAAGAQAWANECTFQHSVSGGKYGENLYTADPMGTQARRIVAPCHSRINARADRLFCFSPGRGGGRGHGGVVQRCVPGP